MKRYNTPHRHRVIKTRLTEEEYAEFSERVTLCQMSQSEYIRQALIKSRIRPVITVSPVNDELLSAVGKLTAEYGKIGGNLNQILPISISWVPAISGTPNNSSTDCNLIFPATRPAMSYASFNTSFVNAMYANAAFPFGS